MIDAQEVVIVGAGPAGCVLAILLARSGVQVTLVERQRVLDREFRGPAYQPAAVRIFDELGVLDEVLSIEHQKFDAFTVEQRGKKLFEIPFNALPPPYNYVLVVRQAPLLRKLIEIAGQYPNFTYLGGEDGSKLDLKADLVVAADGRYSMLREAAGIEVEERPQAFDVLWFEVAQPAEMGLDVGFHVTPQGLLVVIPKEEGLLQVGWLLQKGEFAHLKQEGIEHFQEELSEIHPSFGEHLQSFDQCALLDVRMGVAKEWSKKGLLLIGDAAHIASPVGALGNKLAIEDAVLAHPLILRYLADRSTDLGEFERMRRPDIERNLHIQRVIGKAIIEVRHPVMQWVRKLAAPLMKPLFNRYRDEIALSPTPVHVDTSPFLEPERRYHLLRVAEVIEETAEAKSFRLEVPRHLFRLYSYWAGQFITVRLLHQGRLLKRCYSLSSCPVEDEHLQITVKRVEGGAVSTQLHEEVAVGDTLAVLPPAGLFTMPDARPHHYFFVAGGSGITPCLSLMRTIAKESPESKISLLYVNRRREGIIFEKELEPFEVTHWITAQRGRPTVEDLGAFLGDGEIYLCGPEGLSALARAAASSGARIREERFLSAFSVQEAPPSAPLVVGDGEAGRPTSITVELDDQVRTVPYSEGQTILDAALLAGLPAPFSCQEGICATCRAKLEHGQVVMDKHEALSKKEASDGFVLTCRAKPLSQQCSVRFQ